jgi:hypothetical protein
LKLEVMVVELLAVVYWRESGEAAKEVLWQII